MRIFDERIEYPPSTIVLGGKLKIKYPLFYHFLVKENVNIDK